MSALVLQVSASEPNVSLVVGNLLPAEGGPADAVSPLKSPFGVDFDSQGNMLIVELEGGRVHRLSPEGELTTIAGDGSKSYQGDGGPAAKATFNGMHNVAVTPNGDIYIADSWNHCIRKIDGKSGTISTFAGTGEAGFSGDGGPADKAKFDFIMCISLNTTNDAIVRGRPEEPADPCNRSEDEHRPHRRRKRRERRSGRRGRRRRRVRWSIRGP